MSKTNVNRRMAANLSVAKGGMILNLACLSSAESALTTNSFERRAFAAKTTPAKIAQTFFQKTTPFLPKTVLRFLLTAFTLQIFFCS
ncbi:hypothetical protein [Iodobacter ciconiae]|uniref:hypothetical protein n=1 Tax=Iodobacter ciconiae TaxID=2496266 RepID=UPI0013E028C6|nr:hypothetical protein [Iodobacter ciconiae]